MSTKRISIHLRHPRLQPSIQHIPHRRHLVPSVAAAIFVSLLFASGSAIAAPRYLSAVQQELARLGYPGNCQESAGSCTIGLTSSSHSTPAAPATAITIVVDDSTATVRISIDDFLPGTIISAELAKRMLEINHSLVLAKLSIIPESGQVSLSAVLNTDSNFDRKSFRSALKGFIEVATQLPAVLQPGDANSVDATSK